MSLTNLQDRMFTTPARAAELTRPFWETQLEGVMSKYHTKLCPVAG